MSLLEPKKGYSRNTYLVSVFLTVFIVGFLTGGVISDMVPIYPEKSSKITGLAAGSGGGVEELDHTTYVPGLLAITVIEGYPGDAEDIKSALGDVVNPMYILDVYPFVRQIQEGKRQLIEATGLDRIYYVKVSPEADHEALVEAFNALDFIQSTDYNQKVGLSSSEPNDAEFPYQWGLNDDGLDVDIDAIEAWDLEIGDPDVVIAVLDSGIDYDHEDLVNKIWTNADETTDGTDSDGNGFIDDVMGWDFVDTACGACQDSTEDCLVEDNDPSDTLGHGTKVAGMAGAETNNVVGVASICQDCEIMNIRVCFDDGGSGLCNLFSILEGIEYAASNGADVISMSFGHYYYDQSVSYCFGGSSYDAVLDYAYDAGVVLVAAVGNENFDDYAYPACYDKVIGVANLDVDGDKSDMSNFGDWVDVAAPGVGIMTTKLDDTYGRTSGTSMSAPFVAGLAGLMLSSYPGFTPAEIRAIIMESSEDKAYWRTVPIAAGRINAFNALNEFCVYEEELFWDEECLSGIKPYQCYEHEFRQHCQACGCPRSHKCMMDGSCRKQKKLISEVIAPI